MAGEEPVLWTGGASTPGTVGNDLREFCDAADLVDYRITMYQWQNPEGIDAPWPGGIVIAYYHPTEVVDGARGGARLEKHWSTVGYIPEGAYKDVYEAMDAMKCVEISETALAPKPDVSRMALLFGD